MFQRRSSFVWIVLLWWYSATCIEINAQASRGVSMSFIKPDSEAQLNEFASNVLRIVNNTDKDQDLSLMLNPPAGWQLMGASLKELKITSKDTLIVPVRIRPSGNMQGDMTYVTNAFLSMRGFTVANAIWNIEVARKSNWNASLSSNKIYFTEGSDSTTFRLNLSNSGNSDEALVILSNAETGLFIKNKKEQNVKSQRQPMLLKVNQDTSLVFTVLRENIAALPNAEVDESNQRYRLKIKVQNERQKKAGKGLWTGNVNLIKLPGERKVEEALFNSFPLTVEWNSYNVLDENTYGSLGMYGFKYLTDNRSFSYYYQANFIQNQINWESLLGNYFYLGYFSPDYSAEVGDITAGRSGSLLVGKGLKGSYTYKNHQLGAIYIGNPSVFNNPFLTGYGGSYNYRQKKIKAEAYYEATNNNMLQIKSNYVTVDASYRVNAQHLVMLGGGYSNENFTGVGIEGVTGQRAMLGYQGNVKQFNISFNGQYHSESYAPRRGVINGSATVAYPLSHLIRLRGGASYFKNQPSDVLNDGSIQDTIATGRSNVFIQMLHSQNGNSYVVQPQYTMYTSNFLDANTAGFNFEYRTRFSPQTSFFSTLFIGQNSFPSHQHIDPIFVSNIRLSLRYKTFNANLRYYYGPFYLNEQMIYVNSLENPQRLFAMVNHDKWFAKNRMRLNINFNYNYTTRQGRHQLVTRPELFYYSKKRFEFSAYANYLLYANAQYERESAVISGSPVVNTDYLVPADVISRIEFGFGIKFNINVPAGIDRNYRANMVVFRDENGNGIKDANEPGYENMLIRVTPTSANFTSDEMMLQQHEIYELITNSDGEVRYNHLPKGNYKIESIPLVAAEGWFSGNEFYKYIEGNQTIYIPLSKGARLSGGIFVERDTHTDDRAIVLAGIRVTAVNQLSGESHSALTDQFGNYSIYLPNGDYMISINEGAVGARYQFIENNIPISVKNSGENYNVGFYLVEKKRQINFGPKRGSNAILRSSPINDNRDESAKTESGLWPVSDVNVLGKGQVIQLFGSEKDRLKYTELDTLNQVITVFCIKGNGGNYLYLSNSINKKGTAKKLLKKVKLLGFNEATVVAVSDLAIEKPNAAPEQAVDEVKPSTKQFKELISDTDKALYRIQIESTAIQYEPNDFNEQVPDIDVIYTFQDGEIICYAIGSFTTEKEANKYLKQFKKKYTTTEAIVRRYNE